MDDGGVKRERTRFIVVFVILAFLIVGLSISIIIVAYEKNKESLVKEEVSEEVSALIVSQQIQRRLTENAATVEEAIEDFEDALDEAQGDEKVYLAIYYADFLYKEQQDISKAVEVLASVEDLINDSSRIDYYVAFRDLYVSAGVDDEAARYDELIRQNMPQIDEAELSGESEYDR